MNYVNAQVFSLKKHNFSVFAGNTHLDCRTPITNYTYGDQGSNYINEKFEIHNQSSAVNPRFGVGYSHRVWAKKNSKLRSSIVVLACDLGYSSIEYNRTRFGTYSGGFRQYFFEGTIKERQSRQFLALGIAAKYYLVTPAGEVFGIAIGFDRHHSLSNNYSAEYHNYLDNQIWTQSLGEGLPSRASWKQKVNWRINDSRDYFSCNLTLSAGKNLGKMFHLGVFLQYSMPEYLFYYNKPKPDTSRLSFLSSSSYLTYFNIINYGIYFML